MGIKISLSNKWGILDFDHIIIGAGSAGCAVAKRLSESGHCQVAVLEVEGGGNNPWLHVPVGCSKTTSNHKSDWRYKTEHFFGIANRASSWARGRFLDGNSVINGVHACGLQPPRLCRRLSAATRMLQRLWLAKGPMRWC